MTDDGGRVSDRFQLQKIIRLHPRFNAAPTQPMPVITDAKPHQLTMMKWGMTPVWWKFPGRNLINIRSESVKEKPLFQRMLTRRCLVIADGYYEWRKLAKGKQPYLFRLKNHDLFAIPGLWTEESDGLAFALITCTPNTLAAKVHDRMPCILSPEKEKVWLDPDTIQTSLFSLLKPYPSRAMEAVAVSRAVNTPTNDDPSLIEAV